MTENISSTSEQLLRPKSGTATSSPTESTASQSNMNIPNVMIWMKKQVYEDSTADEEIRKAIEDDCTLVCQADGKTYFKKPA